MRALVPFSLLLLFAGCGPTSYSNWKNTHVPEALAVGDEESLRDLLDTEVEDWPRYKLAQTVMQQLIGESMYAPRSREQVRWDLVKLLVQWEPAGAMPHLAKRYDAAVGADDRFFPGAPQNPADEYYASELKTISDACPDCGAVWAQTQVGFYSLLGAVRHGHKATLAMALAAAGEQAPSVCALTDSQGYGLMNSARDLAIIKLLESCGAHKHTEEEAAAIKAELRVERRRQEALDEEEQRLADIDQARRRRAENERYRREQAAQRRRLNEWNASQASQNAPSVPQYAPSPDNTSGNGSSDDSTASGAVVPTHEGPETIIETTSAPQPSSPSSKTAPPPASTPPLPPPVRQPTPCGKGQARGCDKDM
jgi:hypothetical protein